MKSHLLDQWPLDERDLSAADRKRLECDLTASPELKEQVDAWHAIEASMHEAKMVAPEPGFAGRWQARLVERRQRSHRRQVNWLLGLLLMGAFGAAVLVAMDFLASPARLGAAWIEATVRIAQTLEAGARYLTIFGDGWPALVGVLAFSAALAWVGVVWAAAMYRYAFGQVQNGVR